MQTLCSGSHHLQLNCIQTEVLFVWAAFQIQYILKIKVCFDYVLIGMFMQTCTNKLILIIYYVLDDLSLIGIAIINILQSTK